MSADALEADVLVVGAGLTGLACAMFLAQQGVRVVAVEQHGSTSLHPKARLVNTRSMELYRAAGIEQAVRDAGEASMGFVLADTLAGEHERWIEPPSEAAVRHDLSPTGPYSCDQQRIEPILRDRARQLGAQLLFSTLIERINHDSDGIVARLADSSREGPAGRPDRLRTRYLVAADGANGGIRAQLGIGCHGEPIDGTAVSAIFRADLEPALRGRHVDALMARSAEAFLFARGDARDRMWQVGTHLRPEWDPNRPETLTDEVVRVIRVATGMPELDVAVDSIQTWTSGAYVADRFRSGRVFLIGDAAHVMPPYGGFGGNTGVQDAHNLAWKLAAVCAGEAAEELLDSYDSERRPIAELLVAQALLRSRKVPGQPDQPDQIDPTTLTLGFRYPAQGADGFDPRRPVEDPAAPSGAPGTRAPHTSLTGHITSTLDLLDPVRFTFIGPAEGAYAAALAAQPIQGVRLRAVMRHEIANHTRWDMVFASSTTAGLLVRPDGVVAWCADPHHPAPRRAIHDAHARALSADA